VAKQNFPKLRFCLNKTLDKKIGFVFWEHKRAGIDFGSRILSLHPQLAKAKNFSYKQRQLIIDKYVDEYYRYKKKQLNSAIQKAENQWQKIEKQFFLAVSMIFNHPWPKGNYIGFLSIFDCNPRFLETKTFQFFWQHHRGYLAVISHEMIHFLFYDYLEKHFPQSKKIPKQKIWALSEITNCFILNSHFFKNFISQNSGSLYPDLKELANKLLPIWKTSKNFKIFLSSILELIQKVDFSY